MVRYSIELGLEIRHLLDREVATSKLMVDPVLDRSGRYVANAVSQVTDEVECLMLSFSHVVPFCVATGYAGGLSVRIPPPWSWVMGSEDSIVHRVELLVLVSVDLFFD